MAPQSVTPQSLPKNLITIFQTSPRILITIFITKISPLNFLGAPIENSFFCPDSDREEIVNLIRRQKNKSTDLMNIPVLVYKIFAPLVSSTFLCALITHPQKIVFLNALKQQKLFKFLNLVTQILLWIIDLYPCCLSCQKYLWNWCVLD